VVIRASLRGNNVLYNDVFRSSDQQYQYLIDEERHRQIRKFVREMAARIRENNRRRLDQLPTEVENWAS
jgi:hypothetical protein